MTSDASVPGGKLAYPGGVSNTLTHHCTVNTLAFAN
jgi:hypothetical protein